MRLDGVRFAPEGGDGGGAGRRAASVTLRGEGEHVDAGALMDPANRSLSEAIRITFRMLQAGMVVLALMYLGSGFRTVREGEQGILLLFGKVQVRKLEPGLHFSAPFPIGEIVKVGAGANTVRIDDVFWVDVPPGTPRDTSPEKLTASTSVKPAEKAGSLLTADGSIVHTRVSAVYRREGTADYAQNLLPDHEEKLVRGAIQRAVVHAVAQVTIDDLLKPGGSTAGSVALKARQMAQTFLAEAKSGIVLDAVALDGTMPPLLCRDEFANYLSAEAKANQTIAEARAQANKILNDAGGEAAIRRLGERGEERDSYFSFAIDDYERALASGDKAACEKSLERIDRLLEGVAVEVDGVTVEGKTAGAASAAIYDARQYATEIVARRKGAAAIFEAKLAQFKANPLLMINREWAEAYSRFMAKDSVQLMLLPLGVRTVELVLNRDPDVLRESEKKRRDREAIDAEKQRKDQMEKSRFDTNPLTTLKS